jgi:shikimate dehydrogenase
LIGHPVAHSLSPVMHNAVLAETAQSYPRFVGWRYDAFDIVPGDLAPALAKLGALGFCGVNLTVPHKVLAVNMVSRLDARARDAGAVNTLLRDGDSWLGFNTDGYGLATGIRLELGIELRNTPVVLLGAGGAARGAAVECLRAGCAGLWVVNRTRKNRDALLAHLAPPAGKVPIRTLEGSGRAEGLAKGAIVINATSAGLRQGEPAPVDLANLPGIAAVYDMIYNPPVTQLLAQAKALGLPCANGLGMLVHQGAKAFEIWTELPASDTAPIMREAAAKALGY